MKAKEKNVNKKGKKKKSIVLRIILLLIIVLILATVILFYKKYKEEGWAGVSKTLLGHNEETVNRLDKMYCLILGQSQNLTDTIILASYDPKTQEAALLSIPRDTFIGENEAYATSWDKINAVYQTGAENTLKEVRELTGINVQYYLKVDTEALKALVDEIGGVYFDVPIDMHYTDRGQNLYIDLKAGYQLLDGDKAEQLVRFRHNSDGSTYPVEYGIEDLGRMRTQKEFLTQLLKQSIEKMDLNKILGFLDIMEKYVETNLNFDAIKDYIPYVLEFNTDNIKTGTLPGESIYANVVYIYSVDEEKAKEMINELFYNISPEDKKDEEESTQNNGIKSIEILNGSGSSSKLNEAISELEASGFNITQSGNTSSTANTTIITRKDVPEKDLNKIKEILNTQIVVEGESDSNRDITIIIGTDYVM